MEPYASAPWIDRLQKRIIRNSRRNTSGCWIWKKCCDRKGYGIIGIGKKNPISIHKTISAHRASWKAFRGEIPADLYVCHTCDVPACVNPGHLWLGTNIENQKDSVAKGRRIGQNSGVSNGRAKLSWRQVLAIKKSSATCTSLAARYGVSISTLSRTKKDNSWKRMKTPDKQKRDNPY